MIKNFNDYMYWVLYYWLVFIKVLLVNLGIVFCGGGGGSGCFLFLVSINLVKVVYERFMKSMDIGKRLFIKLFVCSKYR